MSGCYEILSILLVTDQSSVTGLCECTSVIGPALGGGHSLLQGQYGFSADNLVSARLILANGTAITVSGTENPHLFWAIRGAGHNFGIVASFEVNVYDIPEGEAGLWTFTILTLPGSVLEDFFMTWNKLEGKYEDTGGSLLLLHGLFNRNPSIDTRNPILTLFIVHEGQNPIADEYISTFRALGTLTFTQKIGIPWTSIHDEMGLGSRPVCDMLNTNFFTTPASFSSWNGTNMRLCFDLYSNFTAQNPLFAGSFWLLESYGRGQTRERVDNAVALEERENHLVPAVTLFWEGDDVEDRATAEAFARLAKETMQKGWSSKHTYVNYAVGDEGVEEMYGHDMERLHRLQSLKRKWDPENRFSFNAPLT